MGRTAVTLGR